MAWYKTGTVSVTNGNAVVYGSGTLWVDAGVLNPGDIWTGPDGKLYEVLNFQSNTELTLVSSYLGSTASGQAYAIMPIGLLPSALAQQVKTTLSTASSALNNALKFDASQTLTTQQKTNVRVMIGLGALATQAADAVAITGGSAALTAPSSVTVNSASPALKVTQNGSGHALVVEDESGDLSPVVITSGGVVGIGTSSPSTVLGRLLHVTNGANATEVLVESTNASSGESVASWATKADSYRKSGLVLYSSSNVELGFIGRPYGTSGAVMAVATGGTERMRIGDGPVAIGSTVVAGGGSGCTLRFANDLTGSVNPTSILGTPIVKSDATGSVNIFQSNPSVEAAAFTVANFAHFNVTPGSLGAGASITNQYGYKVSSSLIGATNNHAFYGDIPAGGGRYNFHAPGTAANYFAGTMASLGSYNTTTASAANAFIDSAGLFQRSTSSIRYKKDVETLSGSYADNVILNARPVWYRSMCENDNAGWGWYGLIAEEIADIDPRLVHWGYPTKLITEVVHHEAVIEHHEAEVIHHEGSPLLDENGKPFEPAWEEVIPAFDETVREAWDETVERPVPDTDAPQQAEGVMYDRLTVMLIDVAQRQQRRLDAQEQLISQLMSRLDALEAA